MGLALGALAGVLSGLGGVPKGMNEATQADQRQQQLDEQVRARQAQEANQTTDLGQLSQMLGITLPGVQPGVKVPNSTANIVATKGLADQAKTASRSELETQRQQVPEKYRPFLGQPGGADLAKLIYGESVPKPTAPHYTEDAEGNIVAITMQNGVPTAVPVPGAKGKGKETPQSRQVAEGALSDKGWTPDMPGYREALYQLMTPMTPIAEGGAAVPRTFAVPGPPQRPGAINPNVPLGQQPTVQAAGAGVRTALDNAAAEANGLPGIPGPQTQARPGPQRTPGGGIQGPAKQQALPAAEAEKIGTFKTIAGMMDRAGSLYSADFVGPVAGRIGGVRQQTDLMGLLGKATPQETEFRATLQSIANQLLYMRSGAAVTPQEYDRIIKELPGPNDPPEVFTVKLATARKSLEAALKNREAEFASRGFRGGEGPAQAAPTSGGTVKWGRDASGNPVPMP